MSEQTEVRGGASRRGLRDIAGQLYRGEAGVDVVGKRRIYYGVAGVILLVAIVVFLIRPFNLSIDFKGGESFTLPATVGTLADARAAIEDQGVQVSSAQAIGGGAGSYLVKTGILDPDPAVASTKASQIKQHLATQFHIPESSISESAVSGSWGSSVTTAAAIGSIVFLVLVMIYLALVFREWRMSVAALAALLQNLVLTAAVYLLIGFEVSPSTVIGFLTILGFALYDVVVVFDKVRENTRGITGNPNRTYGEAANLAVNQTLMRSINTAVVALLPVGGLLFIGAGLLGAGTLKDLGLVLFVGMLAAVYSSIFFATPVLVDLKEQEPRFKLHKQRVLQRRAGLANAARAGARRTSRDGTEDELDADGPTPALAGAAARSAANRRTAAGGDSSDGAGSGQGGATRSQPRKRTGGGAKPGGKPRGARSGGGRKR